MDRKGQYRPRILLLEDNMKSMQNIMDMLDPAGYEMHYSIAGHNLSEMLYTKKYDLLLFNMMVEGMNGFDVLKRVKQSDINEDVPVVFITDKDNNGDLMQGIHVTGTDFLRSPFTREELLTRISNQISLNVSNEKLKQSRLVTKSIQYAERIQKAMQPGSSFFEDYFSGHFLISMPRDIVSGDFYWAKKIDHMILVAVADCTGHGVPGAFLSVLGTSLLNEICMKYRLDDVNKILDNLRYKLKKTLLKAEYNAPISDGMDISLIMINTQKMTMQFAGAYHKLIVVQNGEIKELSGDLQPIGFHLVETEFTKHVLEISEGTKIYFSTDGFVDQFGGASGKKYQYRKYRRLIHEISSLDMEQQKLILMKEHLEWKGINDQVDDILMLGLEI